MSTAQVIQTYSKHLPTGFKEMISTSIPEWLTHLTDLITVKLIETQRLLDKSKEETGLYTNSIQNLAKSLADIIKDILAAATDLANNLDRTYVNRLIKEIELSSSKEYKDQDQELLRINSKQALLNQVGLVDSSQIEPITNISNKIQKNGQIVQAVIDVYIEDSRLKLRKYDDLASKLLILQDTIRKRFINKQFEIDKEGVYN